MARFLTRDTYRGDLAQPLTLNRWAYANGNPINMVDPSGHFAFAAAAAACIASAVCAVTVVAAVTVLAVYTAWWLSQPENQQAAGRVFDICVEGWTRTWDDIFSFFKPSRTGSITSAPTNPGGQPGGGTGGGSPPGGPSFWYTLAAGATTVSLVSTVAQPAPAGQQLPLPLDQQDDQVKPARPLVLVLGEGDFSYSYNLASKQPGWDIVGTNYGDGSNSQTPLEGGEGILPNVGIITNVDATRLEQGWYTGVTKFDAIVFNAPRGNKPSGSPGWIAETEILIGGTIASAQHVLKPGGELRFSGTGGMPGKNYLASLVSKGAPLAGYSGSYVEPFMSSAYGVQYNAYDSRGRSLPIDWSLNNFYVFRK